jgi:hypothetical protein
MKHCFSGRAKIQVINHDGSIAESRDWQDNLLLDQGLDRMAVKAICDIFSVAVKGTGVTVTQEDLTGTSNTYSQSGTTITRTAGTRNFTGADVGRLMKFEDANQSEAHITVINSTTSVDVDVTNTPFSNQKSVIFYVNQTAMATEAGRTNNYSTVAGDNSTVTGTGATINQRTFQRTFVFDPETANTTYTEVGFSDSMMVAANINIRILLNSGVAVNGPSGGNPGQQLKVTYQMVLTVFPKTAAADNGSMITDSGNQMSGNKSANSVIESFFTSVVGPDGVTDISNPHLDPYYPSSAALSPVNVALAPFAGTVRGTGANIVDMTADIYTPGSFSNTYEANWGISDASGLVWRSLCIIDTDSGISAFTRLFTSNQTKDGNHSLNFVFEKTWGRALANV